MVLLIADSFLKLQKVNRNDYFLPQLEVLGSEKIHDFEILWSEDKPMAESALAIKERILKSSTPVTIIAHGKGGLDAIECLLQNPELQNKVETLVTMQSPIWGTPIADFLTGHPIMGVITMGACKFMGCSLQVIEEMSEFNRQVYMILNKDKLRKLMKNVSIVTVGSSFESPMPTQTFFEKIMKRMKKLVSDYAGVNDGMVPLLSTRISDESHVQLQNVTHLSLVTPTIMVAGEVENLTRNILRSTKTSGLSEYPLQFPSAQSAESSGLKPVHSYQLEIS